MVKGVNKSIIEVNETGSDIFEKIVFYVSPKYASLGAKALKKASEEIEKSFLAGETYENGDSLRFRVKRKSRRNKIILISAACIVAALTAFSILKFVF